MPTAPRAPAEPRALQLASLLQLGFSRVEEPLAAEVRRLDTDTWQVSQTVASMGTLVSITALASSGDRAEAAMGRAFAEMCRSVDLLNRYDSASALAVLNSEGRLPGAPPELLEVVQRSQRLCALSSGAFDVTVAPLVDLLRARHEQGLAGPAPAAELRAALDRVGSERLHRQAGDLYLHDGASLTLDGIAKGYVVDRMAGALAAAGIDRYLVNAGGDIRTSGCRHDGGPWRVAVRDPDSDVPIEIVAVHSGALATSGSYEIHFDSERKSHHIVRAADGASPAGSVSVTVRAASAMLADSLATAVFVMGPEPGLKMIESFPGCDALVVTPAGRHRSSGWKPHLETTDRRQRA